VSRLKQAGLADQIPTHQELLEEFGAGDGGQNSSGPCKGVNGRLAHDHIFYRDGRFASVNEKGVFVDDDHYILPNDHTIVFHPGNDSIPPITAHFRFSDDLNTVTFDLVLPNNLEECSESCRGDYEWVKSRSFCNFLQDGFPLYLSISIIPSFRGSSERRCSRNSSMSR
jgi:hypothetical protein